MLDPNPYIGIPFEAKGRTRAGLDCWGLVWLVHGDHGIGIPSYADLYNVPLDKRQIAALVALECEGWAQVETPRPLDVITLRVMGQPWHVGVVVRPGVMLHILEGIDACLERYDGMVWRDRVVKDEDGKMVFFRYQDAGG